MKAVVICALFAGQVLALAARAGPAQQNSNLDRGDGSSDNAIQVIGGPDNPKPAPISDKDAASEPGQDSQAEEQAKKNLMRNGMSEEKAKKRVQDLKAGGFFEAQPRRGPPNDKPAPIRDEDAAPEPGQSSQAEEQAKKNLMRNGMSEEEAKKRVQGLKASGFFEAQPRRETPNDKPAPISSDDAKQEPE